uniref:Pesticidal crystal protein N-terminal domain-containing protein n=1 Tax=Mucochytrium quahogii TaxID=96639 RepID=A0A7S2WAK0_9STRA|eukprot:CAMPEP_0203756914 /NCGR_PEP_ID=MMETSP0098-20131031/10102_1 /ASSEMBLY_ACC=CAM_ASM_000208 /TAXON_ID=96639 /ORGANISM=" , Strain NY0313808BC1" /LENGTH=511 /DNA_ID=CAMNT_0050648965 /DNA_START=30 /DNA_END=1562 /DNA_ORIENTATION=-
MRLLPIVAVLLPNFMCCLCRADLHQNVERVLETVSHYPSTYLQPDPVTHRELQIAISLEFLGDFVEQLALGFAKKTGSWLAEHILDFFFPSDDVAQVFQELINKCRRMIDHAIAQEELLNLNATLQTARDFLKNYAYIGTSDYLVSAIAQADHGINVIQDLADERQVQLIPMYVALVVLEGLCNLNLAKHYTEMGNTTTHIRQINETGSTLRQRNTHLGSMYQKWLVWRRKQLVTLQNCSYAGTLETRINDNLEQDAFAAIYMFFMDVSLCHAETQKAIDAYLAPYISQMNTLVLNVMQFLNPVFGLEEYIQPIAGTTRLTMGPYSTCLLTCNPTCNPLGYFANCSTIPGGIHQSIQVGPMLNSTLFASESVNRYIFSVARSPSPGEDWECVGSSDVCEDMQQNSSGVYPSFYHGPIGVIKQVDVGFAMQNLGDLKPGLDKLVLITANNETSQATAPGPNANSSSCSKGAGPVSSFYELSFLNFVTVGPPGHEYIQELNVTYDLVTFGKQW